MKLNFWQWLGVVLLVVATVLWIMRLRNERRQAEFNQPSMMITEEEPTTEPTTQATTAPGA